MGWCSGSYLGEKIFVMASKHMSKAEKKELANMIYEEFSNMDADCWDDSMEIMKYIEEK